ncbi:GH3 auxin-responsive promoter family protein [Thiorhodovibrio frisius]|uniref:GH3 auxin-responsive promoter-binding protein n=1 Tax=Thiorhodovibrio frisius TaxID=631362 RepID=H8Z1N3_9GAMM|nr:GH3 auxin-responsive promoter family protein [Thiorhodovibrio frisius]EIC21478.1 GH3 auxin-responsive promoter-binding protein [Thiorhodovibrio frisius]WPL24064.1 GH3 auxin-responsive promoter [Thiorhodovibrio frisius]
MSAILNTLIHTVTRARWHGFLQRCRDLRASQCRLLEERLERNADTVFGREHDFKRLKSPADFARAVPVSSWETVDPYVDRIIAGETNILTLGPLPAMFNKTSGTTGKPKLIPVTAESTKGNSLNQKIWAFAAIERHPRFLGGKVFPVVNKAIEGYTQTTNIPYGAVSGLMVRDAHPLARAKLAYPYDAVEIEDFTARRYAMMRCAVPRSVTFIPGSNPNALLKLFESADERKTELFRDIHDGTLSKNFDIPGPIRATLSKNLKPEPAKARELERLAGRAGRLRPRDYWPDLKLIGCWKGGTVGQFAHHLQDWCAPGLTLRDSGYMASEAHITIPISDDGNSGLLTVHTNFFEFIPEEEFGQPDAPVLMAHELEIGTPYQILMTTAGGLYRYSINDVIEVTDFFHGAPLVSFLRKGRDVMNLQGEKVSANQILIAVQSACAETGVTPMHFMVVGESAASRYHLHIEAAGSPPAPDVIQRLLACFNARLCELNHVVKRYRELDMLKPPALSLMEPGWLGAIVDHQVASGMRDTQFKPAILGPERPPGGSVAYTLDPSEGSPA